jgi:hypothetical protein
MFVTTNLELPRADTLFAGTATDVSSRSPAHRPQRSRQWAVSPAVVACRHEAVRDLVVASFSSMVSLAGLLLALMGFIFIRYDTLKSDTTIDPERLTPFRITLVSLVVLMAIAALAATLAIAWLLGIASFDYPLWLIAALVIAIPMVGLAALKLRW